MTIAERVQTLRSRVAEACARSGRAVSEVTIVAVSKGHPASAIEEVVNAGIRDVGENRVQELREKMSSAQREVRWHFLGAIQTNKVRHLEGVSVLHGLHRLQEAEALNRRGDLIDRCWDVLVEVNVARERTKRGIDPADLAAMVERLGSYPRLRVQGLMVMAPMVENPEDVRWVFAEARRLRERVRGAGLEQLSMGMTDDFEVAVEEGATLVRIGRAIFGRR